MATKSRWETLKSWLPITISLLALAVSVGSLWATWSGVTAAWTGVTAALDRDAKQEKEVSDRQKEEVERAWQATVVFQIIEEGTKENDRGVTLAEIKDKYQTRALAAEGIDFDKRKLQELELRRVLLSLLGTKDIYQTTEDRYATNRATGVAEGRAEGLILCKVSAHPGLYDVDELRRIEAKEAFVPEDLFDLAINALIAQHKMGRDVKGKLYPIAVMETLVGLPEEPPKKPPEAKPPADPVKPPPC